jgi:site-specific DNA-adenine methylase
MSHFLFSITGNKRQDIKHFKDYFPDNINYVVEPFCGSSAVAFYLNKNSHLNDSDEFLIKTYKLIQKKEYDEIHKKCFKIANKKIKTNDKLYNYVTDKMYKYTSRFKKDKVLRKITKKKIEFKKFITDKCKLTYKDYKNILKEYEEEKEGYFIFLDPPYFQSSNTDYSQYVSRYQKGTKIIKDNTTLFIDILNFLKTTKNKTMLIINDNSINRYIYNGFIKGTYNKTYSQSNGITKHLIICNY